MISIENNCTDKAKKEYSYLSIRCRKSPEFGQIDKVKKKPVPILTLRKEYGIVIKHRIISIQVLNLFVPYKK